MVIRFYENNTSPNAEPMKKYFNLIIIAFLLFSCNNANPKVDPKKIIGKEYNINSLPYGKYGLYEHKYINGVRYLAYGVYYKNKVLVYLFNDTGIQDYYFSNFVDYNKVKNIPLGTSYENIINMFGEPVGKYDNSYFFETNLKEDEKIHLVITYFQKEFNGREISPLIVSFSFNNEGKLLHIAETKTAP